MNFPVNDNDPMDGIIKYLNDHNKASLITANETSYRSGSSDWKPASGLFDQNTPCTFKFNNKIGEYFEIQFLKGSYVTLTGFGFLAGVRDCSVPRNWNVSCMSENTPKLLYEGKNDKGLCPSISGSKLCSSGTKKAFTTISNSVKCTRVRFTTTGPASYSTSCYYFALCGIELFGRFSAVGYFNKATIKYNKVLCEYNIFIYILIAC